MMNYTWLWWRQPTITLSGVNVILEKPPTAVAFIDGCMLHCTRLASNCYVKQVTGYGYVHVLGPMRDVRLYHYLGCSVIQIYCYQLSGFLQWPPLSVFYHSDARLKDLKIQIMSS